MRARGQGYAAAVDAAGNYHSGDDYVVEFLGYRFTFNAVDFEQRVTAAAVKLGLVAGNELDDDETADLVELVERDAIESPAARSAGTSFATGTRLSLVERRVARLLAEEARLPRRLARPSREGGEARGRLGRRRAGLLVPRPERRPRAARAPPHAELARAPVPADDRRRAGTRSRALRTSRRCSRSTRRSAAAGSSRSARSRWSCSSLALRPLAAARARAGARRRPLRDGRRGDRLARLGRLPLPAAQPAALHPARARARLSERARARAAHPRRAPLVGPRLSAPSAGGSPG